MKHLILLLSGVAAVGFAEPGQPSLSLDQALEMARIHSPKLKAARLQTQAAGEAVNASGRWKNPELDFEAEGIGGDLDGFDDTEYTLALRQTFERGGKRKHGRAAAEQAAVAAFQAEAANELALLAEVRQAFIEAAALQETAKVRAEQEKLAAEFVEVAKERFDAGGASELELLEAELSQDETAMERMDNAGELKTARIRLASLIGIPVVETGRLTADYYTLPVPGIRAVTEAHPLLRQRAAEVDVLRAEAALAGAADAADITLGAGVRYQALDDENTFVFGASIPLNFVRSGKAAQSAALTRAEALAAEGAELRRRLQQELSVLLSAYTNARQDAEMTRDRLIPKAERAYELSKAGYDVGRFSWIERIATQQHLAEIRIRYIEALREAHLALAEISRFMQEDI
ncbi:TolC family protein [Pontiella agarivorans]|uniref:TolC family protein n=1 Tax=Pontiella agarivorans TaxID=3038953 RepID=A0ABU5MWX9_9BACT|nr:TolC family protein [Pontiella agarivorans]MDZ8118679.1 TolC family protein [Pontiella agarivorans]